MEVSNFVEDYNNVVCGENKTITGPNSILTQIQKQRLTTLLANLNKVCIYVQTIYATLFLPLTPGIMFKSLVISMFFLHASQTIRHLNKIYQ